MGGGGSNVEDVCGDMRRDDIGYHSTNGEYGYSYGGGSGGYLKFRATLSAGDIVEFYGTGYPHASNEYFDFGLEYDYTDEVHIGNSNSEQHDGYNVIICVNGVSLGTAGGGKAAFGHCDPDGGDYAWDGEGGQVSWYNRAGATLIQRKEGKRGLWECIHRHYHYVGYHSLDEGLDVSEYFGYAKFKVTLKGYTLIYDKGFTE